MKVITFCGSIRFADEMVRTAERLTLAGNCVLIPIMPTRSDRRDYTAEEIALLGEMHLEKISRSDAILVMNVGGYIGEATAREIAFAKELGKEILYYTDLTV